jgi:hypothetical protein
MADEKLTQQPIATSAADNDLFYIVRVSDGLSMQITKDNFLSNFLKGNQTITLSGDATGSGTTSIAVTVVDNSHNHTIGNVTGLQAQLNLKANLTAITKALIDALGVNAGTLDGIDSSQFLRSDVDDAMNGTINFILDKGINLDGRSFLLGRTFGTGLNLITGDFGIQDNGESRFTFFRTTGNFTATGTTEANAFKLGNWDIEQFGTSLVFKNNGVTQLTLSNSGVVTATKFSE